jgi:ABC-type Na+ transport system ATPase subunit NatA
VSSGVSCAASEKNITLLAEFMVWSRIQIKTKIAQLVEELQLKEVGKH